MRGPNKKKPIIMALAVLATVIYIFFLVKANENYPSEYEIDTLDSNQPFIIDNCEIEVLDTTIDENDQFGAVYINYRVKNLTEDTQDCSSVILGMSLYQNFANSIPQNINHEYIEYDSFDTVTGEDSVSEPLYTLNDFSIDPGSEKIFNIKYMLDHDRSKNNFFLYIPNDKYYDLYSDKLSEGIFYYRIVNLGDLYAQSK